MKTKILAKALAKEMDRKEFLLFLGMVLITFIGIPRFIRSLTEITEPKKQNQTQGFGAGPYGGMQKGGKV